MSNLVRKILKELHKDGWYEVRQNGSRVQFKHPVKKGLLFQFIQEVK